MTAAPSPRPRALLWGAGSQGRLVEAMIQEADLADVVGLFDPTLESPKFSATAQFIQNGRELARQFFQFTHFVVCIGNEHGYARTRIAEALEIAGLKSLDIIHAESYIDPTCSLEGGLLAMPGAVVHKFCRIGRQVIVNTNATVDHECVVGDGCHVMGGATIAGRVELGRYVTIGTNATVLPSIRIGEGAYVGAGAVVTRDVGRLKIVQGSPARVVRDNPLSFNAAQLEHLPIGEKSARART